MTVSNYCLICLFARFIIGFDTTAVLSKADVEDHWLQEGVMIEQ